jgi:hypothetical protein
MGSVRFFTLEHYRLFKRYGSTQLRVHNLLRYWPEARLWRPGARPDVLVLQKAYGVHPRAPVTILDISDPDWEQDSSVMPVVRQVDAVTCPTEGIAKVLSEHAARVVVIPDRHDLAMLPPAREHFAPARRVVWFGWSHNSGPLNRLVPTIESASLSLTVVSDRDPRAYSCAKRPREFRHRYSYRRFRWSSIHAILSDHDVCLVPRRNLPSDQFKSDNREMLALLCGVPSARSPEELLDLAADHTLRSRRAADGRAWAMTYRDCRQSVAELQALIASLTSAGDKRTGQALTPKRR